MEREISYFRHVLVDGKAKKIRVLTAEPDEFCDLMVERFKVPGYGYVLERETTLKNRKPSGGGVIVAITRGVRRIHVGDQVVSNGRFREDGLRGTVVKIHLPGEAGRTSNILDVVFEGESNHSTAMKFEDLK